RDPSRPLLRQVAFAFQSMPQPAVRLDGLSMRIVTPMELDLGLSRLDLTLYSWQEEGRIRASFEYNTDLFDRDTVAAWADLFCEQVQDAVRRPERPIGEAAGPRSSLAEQSNLSESQLLFWFGKKAQPDVRLYFEHVTTLITIPSALDPE